MKLFTITAALVVSLVSAIANAGTAVILMSGKNADAVMGMVENWKNEKSLGEKLYTSPVPEVLTSEQMAGLPPGAHLVAGVCDQADAETVLPVLQALYPSAHTSPVELAASGSCPKLVSQPTKVSAKHTEKGAGATLTVAIFDGTWDKGETLQMAIANVRDKDGDLVDTYSQRVGTILGGETCRGEMKVVGKVITINRSCEGTKDIETKKLSLAKNRLKIE
jgi:hypothetical protein